MEINSITNDNIHQLKKTPSSNQPVSVIIYSNMNELESNQENTENLISTQQSILNDNSFKNSSIRMQQLKKNKVKKIVNNYDHSKYVNKSLSTNENNDNNKNNIQHQSSPSSTSASCQLNSTSSIELSSSDASSDSLNNNITDNKISNNETESDSTAIIISNKNNENSWNFYRSKL